MKKTKLTALCGMMSALSVVLMLSTSVLPVLAYTLPLVTGIITHFVDLISSKKYAVGVYFATSILSLLLLTDKETALVYALFFGYYPLVKPLIEKLPKIFSRLIKLAAFNSACILIGVLGVVLLGVASEEYTEFGYLTVPILLGLANLMFLMYDILLSKYKLFFNLLADKIKKILK